MQLRHIVAAVDESDASRNAVRLAIALAAATGARLTVMTVVAISPPAPGAARRAPFPAPNRLGDAVARLERWLGAEIHASPMPIELGAAAGVPGIEICRFAEERGADLVVLGRKPRSQAARLLVGDTADAVARRSLLPCLLVPGAVHRVAQVLGALDGSERGLVVLGAARDFAQAVGAALRLVTVDATSPHESPALVGAVPSGRAERLVRLVERTHPEAGHAPLDVRHGEPTEAVLAAVAAEPRADVLVVGYHRGGPPGVVEAGSTARRLAHQAPCAVLTVPL